MNSLAGVVNSFWLALIVVLEIGMLIAVIACGVMIAKKLLKNDHRTK